MVQFDSPHMIIKVLDNCINIMSIVFEKKAKNLNADNLFPLLVWVVIFANPDNFKSILNYALKWLDTEKLMGKSGYIISTFIAVCEFLDNLNGSALMGGELQITKKRKSSFEAN